MSHRFSIILVLVFLMVPCYCIAKPLSGIHDDNLGDDVYSEGEKITSSIGTKTSGKHEMKFMDTKQAIDNSEESDLSSGRFAFRRLRRRSSFKIPVNPITTVQYEENCKPPKTMIDNLTENPNTAAMLSLSELAEAQEVYRSQRTTATVTTVAYQGIQKRSDTEYTEAENVCTDVLKRLNLSVSPNSDGLDCPWRYTCDYVGNRFPRYIIQANCTKFSYCQVGCGNVEKICRPITAQMTVLYGDCNVSSGEEEQYPGIRNPESNWSTEQFEITLGCKCTPLE